MKRRWKYGLSIALITLSVLLYLTGSYLWSHYDLVPLAWGLYTAAATLQAVALTIAAKIDRDRRMGHERNTH